MKTEHPQSLFFCLDVCGLSGGKRQGWRDLWVVGQDVTVGGFFRLYNLMRSSPHTFKASKFHQGNLTKINPDPEFPTFFFKSRISTQKKTQCNQLLTQNFNAELQPVSSVRWIFALNFWYENSKFKALNFCIFLPETSMHWTFALNFWWKSSVHWTFALNFWWKSSMQNFNALNFCIELLA